MLLVTLSNFIKTTITLTCLCLYILYLYIKHVISLLMRDSVHLLSVMDLCNSIPAIDIQTKYCYPVLTSDGHCIRIARISVDWTAGWLVY